MNSSSLLTCCVDDGPIGVRIGSTLVLEAPGPTKTTWERVRNRGIESKRETDRDRSQKVGSLRNVWFIFFVIACILFAMPFNLPVFRIFDALVIALLLRIPTSLLATRTLWASSSQ